jgi:glycosyltransferase involved in cell wall biosynthesis
MQHSAGNTSRPKLSVIVVFYNMRREARRTLLSLTTGYQRGLAESDYEVIALDSASSEPLDGKWVESLQPNFRHHYVESAWPSPCRALNRGAELARAPTLVNLIDGARILSPGILALMLMAQSSFDQPFVYTIGMHLGREVQNDALAHGYDQRAEDALLSSVPWEHDGYQLFRISCLAGSAKLGYLNPFRESNCFAVDKRLLASLGGFDERFRSPGGGLVNLDIFSRLHNAAGVQNILLVGEATFHQFHGGVASNVAPKDHPWRAFQAEYTSIRGKPFDRHAVRSPPFLLGELRPEALPFFLPPELDSGSAVRPAR